jgi:hypothetical protein
MDRRRRVPFGRGVCNVNLYGPGRNRVFLRDRKATEGNGDRKGILAALMRREGQGIDVEMRSMIDSKVARSLAKAIDEAGIRPSQKSRRIGDYVLGDLIADGPGYQDRLAEHVSIKNDFPTSPLLYGSGCRERRRSQPKKTGRSSRIRDCSIV